MPLDGISSHFLASELNTKLAGARIDKIYQPSRFEVYFLVRTNSENIRVLLCCDPQDPRVQITSSMRENPQMPPNFCMLLRKHLSGARILSVECPSYERIIIFTISTTDELHDTSTKRLIIEMMGRYSNIIFLNSENRIIDALVHVDSSTSRIREIMPARIYEAPPSQGKMAPEEALAKLDADTCPILETSLSRPLNKALLDSLLGFSPLMVNDICYRAHLDIRQGFSSLSDAEKARVNAALRPVLENIVSLTPDPTVYYIDGEPKDWHALSLEDGGSTKHMATISEAIDMVSTFRDKRLNFESKRRQLRTIVSSALEHASKKLSIHQDDIHDTDNANHIKEQGELILAYQYLIRPDDELLTIPDYPDFGQSVQIKLEPGMTPSEQGQLYLKRYRKAMSRRESAMRFIEEEQGEVDYLQSLIQAIDAANEPDDLLALSDELSEEKVNPASRKTSKSQENSVYHPGKAKSGKASSRALRQAALAARQRQKKDKSSKKSEETAYSIRKYKVDHGFEVLSGRNNIQNDHLTFQIAEKDDLWFHAKNMPGTHVILKTDGREPTDKAIVQAASIAAYYSKSNKPYTSSDSMDSSYEVRVEIDYCPVSHVKKIPKAKPGMVIYEGYSTLLVNAELPSSQETKS